MVRKKMFVLLHQFNIKIISLMETKLSKEIIREFSKSSGWKAVLGIVITIIIFVAALAFAIMKSEKNDTLFLFIGIITIIAAIAVIFLTKGLLVIQPNHSAVLTFFGKYSGTIKENGFYWINPFYSWEKLSLRARNIDVEPIKVNDKNGNPIMIGAVLVCKIEDTYKASFDIDTTKQNYGQFIHLQSDAALRKLAGLYAYDHIDSKDNETTLRSGGEEINTRLEQELTERLSIAGIKVVEARINYLAYAQEIASAMLRRQQADAIISARERIVEGAVSMVELALNQLSEKKVVELDEEKKAQMVSNLLVVLCADEAASPVVNAGTLY